ncbi:MAG: cell division protein FtsZ [Bacteroidia bacterium]|nr:cell division protein FtsZ [Bacteroidia bacterium]
MEFQMPKHKNSIIKVIGVGGGGGNAVNNMFTKGIKGVDFIVCNTDMQALDMSPVPNKIRLGVNQTEGLGAGANPDVGRKAAMESMEQLRDILSSNTKMVFVTAGMGGGTGTGAAPVIAGLAKEMGILTVAIVTLPFRFEGKRRIRQAQDGIKELEKAVDTLLVINNDNLTHIFGQNVTMKRAFEDADSVLCDAARGIAEIITREGYINVDFADVQTIMRDGGTALMGAAIYEGEDRAIRAAEEAISSPLLDNVSIQGSTGILVNICATEDSLRLDETTTIIEYIQEAAGDDADIIFGTVYDNEMGDQLSVTVIATGFKKEGDHYEVQEKPVIKKEQPREDLSLSAMVSPMHFEDEFTSRVEPTLFDTPSTRKQEDQPSEQRVLEDRIRKLKQSDYDYHNNDSLKNLENIPAYLRKQIDLAQNDHRDDSKKLSRFTLDEIVENRYELNDNNSFLHDNVD